MREAASHAPTEAIPRPVEAVTDADLETLLGAGSRVSGQLFFDGSVRLAGQIDGQIRAAGTLVVEQGGVIKAKIEAGVVIVHGRVLADVTARERIEIGAGGTVLGNLSTPALVIYEGGVLEGGCAMPAVQIAPAQAA